MKLAVVPVSFAKIDAIGTVFTFIPYMIVMMVAIVIARMVAASGNYHFLSSSLGCCRCGERGSQKNKTQIFCCYVQVILPDENSSVGVLACSKYERRSVQSLSDSGHNGQYANN
jgi:hypothetical protein